MEGWEEVGRVRGEVEGGAWAVERMAR